MKNSNKKGFTLVELVVVIAIIGVLAAILVPALLGYVKKSKLKKANANAKTIYNAVATAIEEAEEDGTTIKAADLNINATYLGSDSSGVDITGTAKKALGSNGSEAGYFSCKGEEKDGELKYTIKWSAKSSGDMVGQYPDAMKSVTAAENATL